MSDRGSLAPARPEVVTDGMPERGPAWVELATSADHKDVGRMFIGAALCFLVVALAELLLLRGQLVVPENDLIESVTFNRLLSIHGATTTVFFAMPFALGLFTYLVPLQIGARSLAFPRLAQLAFYLYLAGGVTLYTTFLYTPPEAGVNPLPPLADTAFVANNGVDAWAMAVGLATLGFVLLAINLAVTLHRLRAPGLAWRRLPSFSWSAVICSYVLIVAGAAMLAALGMLEIDRRSDGVFFDAGEGGAPLYWQHLSWIFFTGAWLTVVISAVGAISEILPSLAGKPPFSRTAIAASMVAIATLGMLAWMQNMFTAAIPDGWLYMAMAAALLLVVPFGVILFNWFATLAGGALQLRAPLLFALGSISTLAFGLVGELAHSVIPVGTLLAGTTDTTANTGYVIVGGGVLGGFAALYYWYPKMTGRTMGETMAGISLALILVGTHLTFIPMMLAGLEGQPADAYRYFEGQDLGAYNALSLIGAVILGLGVLATLANAALSVTSGARAGHDPWRGETLEWFATSPPPEHNFDVIPDVRSDQPLLDIRDAIERRTGAAATSARKEQPVA